MLESLVYPDSSLNHATGFSGSLDARDIELSSSDVNVGGDFAPLTDIPVYLYLSRIMK